MRFPKMRKTHSNWVFTTAHTGNRGCGHSHGGNHTGVCLLFDKKILEKEIKDRCGPTETLICGKVEYGDFFEVSNSISWMRYMDAFQLSGDQIIKDGLEAALLRHRDEFKDVFFFQKNKDWENAKRISLDNSRRFERANFCKN